MKLHTEKIPDGSVLIMGTEDEFGKGDLELVVTLFNLGEGHCEARAAKGHLSDYTNIEIGVIALDNGFRTMDFKARQGQPVTRYAKFLSAKGHFNYYTIDLMDTAIRLGIAKA